MGLDRREGEKMREGMVEEREKEEDKTGRGGRDENMEDVARGIKLYSGPDNREWVTQSNSIVTMTQGKLLGWYCDAYLVLFSPPTRLASRL